MQQREGIAKARASSTVRLGRLAKTWLDGHIDGMRWKIFQLAIVVTFLFSDVYFEWGMGGLAAGVAGGLVAYHLTLVIIAVRGRLTGEPSGLEALPQWRRDAGLRLAARKEARSRDKIARGGS
jgi:hypothetical protein